MAKRTSQVSAWVVTLVAGAALMGWVTSTAWLLNPLGGTTMRFGGALGFTMLGTASLLTQREEAARPEWALIWLLSGGAALLGMFALAEHIAPIRFPRLQWEQLADGSVGGTLPDRMALSTALCLIVFAAGIVLDRSRKPRIRLFGQLLAVTGALLGFTAFVDQVVELDLPYEPGDHRHMSMYSAAFSIALGVASVLRRPREGLLAVAFEPGPGREMVVWLLPAAVLIPPLLSAMRTIAYRTGWMRAEYASALTTVANVALISALVLWSADRMREADRERRTAENLRRGYQDLLKRSNQFLDAVVENIPNMLFIKDAETLAFTRLNRAGEELLGMQRDELIGKTDSDFFPPEQAAFFQEKDRETLRDGRVVVIPEEQIDTKHGKRWLATKKVPLLDSETGTPKFLLGISEDITFRKQIADALTAAKERAEAANRELEAFSYSVSHDLRAPVRGIDGFARAALEDYGDALDAQGKEYLNRISAAAVRMGQLIDGLLDLSRLNRIAITTQKVSLSALAEEIVAELRQQQPTRNVAAHIAPDLWTRGDPRLLRAVLQNLLQNAWKFTARTEAPEVTLARGEAMADQGLCFLVRDNGVGFDMKYANKLFGAFQRLHAAAEFPGSGIGLATVHRVIARHGGRVWAEAELGRGATFFFTLPDPERSPT